MMLSSIFGRVHVSQKIGFRSIVQRPLPSVTLVRFYSDNDESESEVCSEDPSGGGENGSPATTHPSGGTNESPAAPHPSAGGSVSLMKRIVTFYSRTQYVNVAVKRVQSFFPDLTVANTIKNVKGFVPRTLTSLNAHAVEYIAGVPDEAAKWLLNAGINKGLATVTGPKKTREDELKAELEGLKKRAMEMEREALEKEREFVRKERDFGEKAVAKEREYLVREFDFFQKDMKAKEEILEKAMKLLKEEKESKQDSGSTPAPPQCVELVGFDAENFFQRFKPTGCNFVVIPFKGDLELARRDEAAGS